MGADITLLHPVFRARLERMMAATGTTLYSGHRSSQEQAELYRRYQQGTGNPANPPGSSNHEAVPWGEPMALAADLAGDLAGAHAVCHRYGIHFPIQSVEPWHCQPVEVRRAYYDGVPEFPPEEGVAGPDVSARRRPPSELRLSSQGAALVADEEGLVPELYNDPVGHCTFGIGHLVHRGPCDGRESEQPFMRAWSEPEVYDLFIREDAPPREQIVRDSIRVPLTQSEFDALFSLAFNVPEALDENESTLARLLNQGDYAGAAEQFGRWVNATDSSGRLVRLDGLVRRRAREAALFRSEWGQRPSLPLAALFQEDDMPTPFRTRPGGFDKKPCYDHEWVPMNAQPITDDLEWRVNIHVQQLVPQADRHANVSIYGPAWGPDPQRFTVSRGDTLEVQPPGYGPVAIVSEDGVELACSWDRVVERAG